MGGKSSTTTQGVSIPPEVLARYNAVNARAEDAASTPFKQYSTSPDAFVAPLTSTQMAGISNTNTAAGQAQPYYQSATGQLMNAQGAAQPYYDAATGALVGGQTAGASGTGAAYNTLNNAYGSSAPIQQVGIYNMGQAYAGSQPYIGAAGQNIYGAQEVGSGLGAASLGSMYGAQQQASPFYAASSANAGQAYAGAQPYIGAAGQNIAGAQNVGAGLGATSLGSLYNAQQQSSPYYAAANANAAQAYSAAQPYIASAGQNIAGAQDVGAGLGATSLEALRSAQQQASPLYGASSANANQAYSGAQGYNQGAAQAYGSATGAAQPYNQAAASQYYGGLSAARPLQQASAQNAYGAQAGAQPFQQAAANLATAGTQGVNAQQIGAPQIGQFMSPYIASVLQGTQGMLNQQNQQAMAGQTANAIQSGAFGGDRAGIAAANLAQQQQLANAQIYSGILNQGYGQSLAAAQQQQGVNLSAEQANRAALQQGSQAMLGIGQQGFGQGMSVAQQQAALAQQQFGQGATMGQGLSGLGQQVFGQGSTTGQNLAALGQQQYGQGMGLSQQQQALAQSLFGQGATTAQQQAAVGQQLFGQGMTAAEQQAALGQQQFGQGMALSQQQQAMGQSLFGQGATTAQQQAAVGQQLFGQGMTAAEQQAALGQQQYAQGMGLSQQQQALGQALFGQGATTSQQQSAVGQQLFGQGMTAAEQQAALGQQRYAQGMGLGQGQLSAGQQLYSQGANTSQQQAALAQQLFGQGATTSQQMAALGQGIYGTGAATSQALAGLGAGAQGASLQGAQAQLAAGQMQQQTQQAGLQALYNQFLQQQSYPFQTAQFLANIAEGTGALSGNTTTTTQPGGFFSDKRLKENVREVGKTFDGQPIYSYNYKGGDKRQQIGLMAQEVENKHPDAVGLAGGYKTVDYGKATSEAAKRGHFYAGGVASMGGSVNPGSYGEGFADGGMPMGGYDPALMQQILQNYNTMYGTLAQPGQPGMLGSSTPGLGGIVPSANLPIPEMLQPADMPKAPESGLDKASQIADLATKGEQIYKGSGEARAKVKKAYDSYKTNRSYKEAASGINDYMDKNGDPMGGFRYRAAGGEVGFDADLAQQMMQRSQGMYGGLAGPAAAGPSAGGPGAMGGIVPASSAPATPTALKAGSPPPKPESGLDRLSKIAGTAASIATVGKGAQDFAATQKTKAAASGVRDYMSKNGDPLKESGLNFGYGNAAGGAVGFAMGGTPYDTSESGNGLDIPAKKKEVQTLKPGDMPAKPDSGLDTVGKVAGTAASIAVALPFLMALNTGGAVSGRKGYATDGEVLDPNGTYLQQLGHQLFIGGTPEQKAAAEQKARDFMRQTGRSVSSDISSAVGAYPAPNRVAPPPPPKGLGSNFDFNDPNMITRMLYGMDPRTRRPEPPQQQASNEHSIYAPTFNENITPSAPRQRGLGAAAASAGAPPAAAPSLAQQEGRLGGTPVPPMAAAMPQQQTVDVASPQANPSPVPQGLGGVMPLASHVQGADEAAFAGRHPFLSGAKDYLSKSENVVPLLAGLAAMGTAPTRSLGVALASGVGAGAKSYMDVRKQQADIGETKARTAQSRAATSEAIRATRESIADMVKKGIIVASPNDPPGTYVDTNTGQKWVIADTTGMVSAAFPSTKPAEGATNGAPVSLYALPEQYAQKARTSFIQANNLDDTGRQQNTALNTAVRLDGRQEMDARPLMLTLADAVGRNDNKGTVSAALATGPFAPTMTRLFSAANSVAKILNIPDPATGKPYQFGQEDIANNTILNKISTLKGATASSNVDQNSLDALKRFVESQPNASLPKETNVDLTAYQMIQSQQAIDRMMEHEAFADAGGLAGTNRTNYLGNDAEDAYRTKFTSDRYLGDKAAIEAVMKDAIFPEMMDDLKSGDAKKLDKVKTKLEEFHPGLSRYFVASVR